VLRAAGQAFIFDRIMGAKQLDAAMCMPEPA
jgi:hypothetical protein